MYFMNANPDLKAVIKPHPLVSIQNYQNILMKLGLEMPNNVSFSDRPPYELLRKSRLLITNYSSLCFDARLMNRKIVKWLPERLPDFMELDWINSVPDLKFEELREIKDEIDSSKYLKIDKHIEKSFFRNLHFYSSELNEVIKNITVDSKTIRFDRRENRRLIYFVYQTIRKLFGLIELPRKNDYAHFQEEKNNFSNI